MTIELFDNENKIKCNKCGDIVDIEPHVKKQIEEWTDEEKQRGKYVCGNCQAEMALESIFESSKKAGISFFGIGQNRS